MKVSIINNLCRDKEDTQTKTFSETNRSIRSTWSNGHFFQTLLWSHCNLSFNQVYVNRMERTIHLVRYLRTFHELVWHHDCSKNLFGWNKMARTSTEAHLSEQSLFSRCVQHKLVKAGVSGGVEGPQRLCGLLDPENVQQHILWQTLSLKGSSSWSQLLLSTTPITYDLIHAVYVIIMMIYSMLWEKEGDKSSPCQPVQPVQATVSCS